MRIIGIDLGKISFKAVLAEKMNGKLEVKEVFWKVHQQEIEKIWQELKTKWQIREDERSVVTGKHRDILFPFPRVVEMVCQKEAARLLYPGQDLTLIRIGGGGFSVLKIKKSGQSEFRQNPRCAAGVGSFLDQIMARVELDILKADQRAGDVKAVEITSRCGVTMKTDFTHLLNTGNPLEEVVAGLLDSSAKNVAALASKSEISPLVLIIGGLSSLKRIVRTIQESLPKNVKVEVPKEALYFEAFGAALVGKKMLEDESFILPQTQVQESPLVFLPALKNSLSLVTKIELSQKESHLVINGPVMGLDIGSTGSKLVIFDEALIFEAYTDTKGQPIEAAKELIKKLPLGLRNQIRAVGCTGSGREIVANLLKASLPEKDLQRIFVLNEIAAHAAGANFYDSKVDTVVDIGGQDAKFTRLEGSRVVDSCMNTVCSAGTGSFLAEQLQLLGIGDVRELGKIALESPRAVDLGQHCAVFISEQIDEARRKGAELPEIVAGLYYSIVRNYNNRVKGLREYGKKIYLQGKPAENLALACALSQVTGKTITVPPSPGSPGALGIALLAKKEFGESLIEEASLNLEVFLESQILERKEFRCQSKDGCLIGNLCSIQEIVVKIGREKKKFFWGGACDKWEKRPGKNPELAKAPRPFIERENLIFCLIDKDSDKLAKTVAIPRGLETEEILPFTITFFQQLGFNVRIQESHSLKLLEQGSKLCQATFCAPLQILAGQAKLLEDSDFIFLPKVIEISGVTDEPEKKRCFVCPLSQAMPDMFSPKISAKVLQPILNFKKGYQENWEEFRKIGNELGCSLEKTSFAFSKAVKTQKKFEDSCRQIGERALEFAKGKEIPAVVVLGHPYIINSSLLSAGIPEAIHENGAVAIPAECYPLNGQYSLPENIYWGYGQRLLQAAFEITRQPGVFPLWLSVYSCGPDSFLLHFFQYLSQGKPYTILESDAYTGQAGFKTRVEAFLYGVKYYQAPEKDAFLPDLKHFDSNENLQQIKTSGRKLLVPWMGESSKTMAALFRSIGINSQALPLGDQRSLELGQKFTSGKECLPMIVTLGGLLKHLKACPNENFYYFMPQASGPCRFGQYQLLFKIILEKLGLAERVKVISPTSETGYQYQLEIGSGTTAKAWAALVFVDFLKDALHDIRPEEKIAGLTQQVFNFYLNQTEELIEQTPNKWFGQRKDLWGFKSLAEKAANYFQLIPRDTKKQGKPTVLLTGEIYVRLDSFANNETIQELENLGCKVKLAPFREWINYVTYLRQKGETLVPAKRWKIYLTNKFQRKIESQLYQIFAKTLGWSKDHHIEEILETAKPYLSQLKPLGEAGLTIGLPLLLWQKKEIQGAVIAGPFECMPSRIAETQLNLISQKTGLPVLNLSFYGDPLDRDTLESFVWDLRK